MRRLFLLSLLVAFLTSCATTESPSEAHGMDVDMQWEGEEEEPADTERDRTPPPTRTYSPMNKMD